MFLKLLFWLCLLTDVVGLALVFVLGLAAAGSAKTNPIAVLFTLLVLPGAILGGGAWLYFRSENATLRNVGMLVVCAPGILFVLGWLVTGARLLFWEPGTLWGSTPLTQTLRALETEPSQIARLRALLAEGADPKRGGEELPITIAIQVASKVGSEPVRLLLEAGADPNAINACMEPAFFAATGIAVPPDVLPLLLDHGANVKLTRSGGCSAVWSAVNSENWKSALLLIERGAPVTGISPMGLPLLETLESRARLRGDAAEIAPVIAAVRARR